MTHSMLTGNSGLCSSSFLQRREQTSTLSCLDQHLASLPTQAASNPFSKVHIFITAFQPPSEPLPPPTNPKRSHICHMVSSTCWKLYIDARHHFAEFSPWLFTGSPLNPLHSACPARCCLAICIRPSNSSNSRFSFCVQIYLSSQVVSQTKTR